MTESASAIARELAQRASPRPRGVPCSTSNSTPLGFSFLEGASVPEELAGACAQFGMPAMALVDRNGVYGAPRFHMAAKKAGIRAHIGAEITCTNGVSYPLLAETREGYQNLCRLITRMKLRAKKGEGAATPGRARRILAAA